MKVSFDFDNTLSHPYIQALAKKYIDNEDEVIVTTTRNPERVGWIAYQSNSDLLKITQELGIETVIYTSGDIKYKHLPTDVDIHYDDDMLEIEHINYYLHNTVGICSRPMVTNLNELYDE